MSTNELVHRVEIRHLRYFLAVAEELHFGRAAQRLNVAQPALSRQIARMEADLQAPLFDRSRAQICLTAVGHALLPQARDLLLRLADLAEVARRTAAGMTGKLAIGFVGSATYTVLPAILRRYRERCPDVDLSLHHMHNAELFHALVERRIQFALTRPSWGDPEIASDLLLREPLLLALQQDDPLASQPILSLSQLTEHSFIMPGAHLEDHLRHVCLELGFRPRLGPETMDLQTALSLVASGLGVALVPASVRHANRLDVVYRPLDIPGLWTELRLSYRRDNHSELLQAFREVVTECASRLSAEQPR